MTSTDPWKNIEPPTASNAFKAYLVDRNDRWEFWWAVGIDRHRHLLLTHSSDSSPSTALPKMKGIETSIDKDDDAKSTLSFKLIDSAQTDIFHRLCPDIISSALTATTEAEAVTVALSRAWRWHHLLRGGRDGRLLPEAQKGLIGELRVVEQVLLPIFSVSTSIQGWGGPLGTPIDFEINRIGIEAKARRGGSAPFVVISSEFQLDESGLDALFLHVGEVDRAEKGADDAITLTAAVERVSLKLGNDALVDFEDKLSAAGFRWDDSYDDYWWIEGRARVYSVIQDFPRITPDSIASGVSGIRYSLALTECEPFLTSIDALSEALRSSTHAD